MQLLSFEDAKACTRRYFNFQSAFVGVLGGLTLSVWYGIGAQLYPAQSQVLPIPAAGCVQVYDADVVLDNNITGYNITSNETLKDLMTTDNTLPTTFNHM